jgi:hypothetical protein
MGDIYINSADNSIVTPFSALETGQLSLAIIAISVKFFLSIFGTLAIV